MERNIRSTPIEVSMTYGVAFVRFGVEIFYLLARILGMLAQIKIRTAMDTFHFLETERHTELHITGRIGIVRQFLMVVKR